MEIEHNALLLLLLLLLLLFYHRNVSSSMKWVVTCHAFEHVQKENGEAKITVMKLSDLQLRF